VWFLLLAGACLCPVAGAARADDDSRGVVNCANLIYAHSKTSVCFSSGFLTQIAKSTTIRTKQEFVPVKLESVEMYQHPFAVMTGEGEFELTEAQRVNLRNYLVSGGFLVASAGCSSPEWASSFRREIRKTFPDLKLARLDLSHPIFHTVYDIDQLDLTKSRGQTGLEGLSIDGKIVLIFSADGLNDTHHAGGNCCCCGGNEIRNARQINVNLLAYALTH
jgi:hypothetical protein